MLKIVPDRTGFAPADMQWMAYDDDHYDGAPDAGPQIVGYGATGDQAEEAYHHERKMMGH